MSAIDDAIRVAITPIVSEANLFLEALQITTAGKHRVIRILVDSLDPKKSLSLDEVTAVTKPISTALDLITVLGDAPFTLEVSSSGVDFPLTLRRHWLKNRGSLVKLDKQTREKVSGRIIDSDETSVRIESKKGHLTELDFSEITRAHVEIEFK